MGLLKEKRKTRRDEFEIMDFFKERWKCSRFESNR